MCYFPKQNVWYKLSDMLFQNDGRSNPSQWRSKIYMSSENYEDELDMYNLIVECYTLSTNSWGAFQVTRAFTTTAVLKGHLYATDREFSGIRYTDMILKKTAVTN